ncbi:hypothetical protein FHW37_102907 [Neorhizobium alkalisoli]|uniref:Copper chaperone NosL n=2 Tax=Neorhizobium alkalisoli TaxID=528178 RepID=A0A561R3S3_9HYPH|nr:hypothetical protein FHW37_102907 [Neorhizobium alkalisoli]
MRPFLTMTVSVAVSALTLASGSAWASSIVTISGPQPPSHSIITKHCSDCSGAVAETASSYKVPTLEPGTQRTEIVEIDGEKKLARTEAWLGGSPVVFVSKVPAWMEKGKIAATVNVESGKSTESSIAGTSGDGVDIDATTSAVSAAEQAPAPQPQEQAAGTPFNPEAFDLRPSKLQ